MLTQLNLARDNKGYKKGFYKYISDKNTTRENLGPLQKEMGNIVTWDMEKTKILNDSSCLCLHWRVL